MLPSREWKRRAKGETWFHGETVITGIGQGFSLATPLQLAAATAVIANRGASVRPRLVRAVQSPGESSPGATPVTPARPPVELDEPAHWDLVTGAMESVVHGRRGTARAVGQGIGYHIAGKTGTAQVFGLPPGDEELDPEEVEERLRDHALFIAFAPVEDPRIVVAVVVENGGSGSAVAAPVARVQTCALPISSGCCSGGCTWTPCCCCRCSPWPAWGWWCSTVPSARNWTPSAARACAWPWPSG